MRSFLFWWVLPCSIQTSSQLYLLVVFLFFLHAMVWVVFACLFSCWQIAVVVRLPHWAQTRAKNAAVIIGHERAQNTQSSSYIDLMSSYCSSVFAWWNQLSAFHKSMCWHKGPRTSQKKPRLHFSGSDTVTCSALFGYAQASLVSVRLLYYFLVPLFVLHF